MLEEDVSDRKSLIDDEDIRVEHDLDGECQTHEHTARIGLDRLGYKVSDIGKVDYLLILSVDIVSCETQHGGVHKDVVFAGKLRIEAASELKESGYSAVCGDGAFGRT